MIQQSSEREYRLLLFFKPEFYSNIFMLCSKMEGGSDGEAGRLRVRGMVALGVVALRPPRPVSCPSGLGLGWVGGRRSYIGACVARPPPLHSGASFSDGLLHFSIFFFGMQHGNVQREWPLLGHKNQRNEGSQHMPASHSMVPSTPGQGPLHADEGSLLGALEQRPGQGEHLTAFCCSFLPTAPYW